MLGAMRRLLFALVAIAACHSNPPSDADIVAATGKPCGPTVQCGAGTTCGTVEAQYRQCALECTMSGSNECPDGTYCTKNATDAGHFCALICNSTAECTGPTGNDTLECNNAFDDNGGPGPLICQVP
jgi:hypothetical protein